MRHVPWVTLVAAALFCASPLGRELYHNAFVSGETISNDLGRFLLTVVAAIALALALIEWTIKFYLRRRRRAGAAGG
jgi:hypothetical protein